MVNYNLIEKLNYKNDRTILIQSLPSSFEKQFLKLSFVKDITPLIKIRKIDFGLIFVMSKAQLNISFKEIIGCLKERSNIWYAFPKNSSKIINDLNNENSWNIIEEHGFIKYKFIDLDNVWGGYKIIPKHLEKTLIEEDKSFVEENQNVYKISIPFELEKLFNRNELSKDFFCSLKESEQKNYVDWIYKAKKKTTQEKRILTVLDKLRANKRCP